MEAFQKPVIVSFPRLVSPRIPRAVRRTEYGPATGRIRGTALGIRAEPKSGIVREPGNKSGAEGVNMVDFQAYTFIGVVYSTHQFNDPLLDVSNMVSHWHPFKLIINLSHSGTPI